MFPLFKRKQTFVTFRCQYWWPRENLFLYRSSILSMLTIVFLLRKFGKTQECQHWWNKSLLTVEMFFIIHIDEKVVHWSGFIWHSENINMEYGQNKRVERTRRLRKDWIVSSWSFSTLIASKRSNGQMITIELFCEDLPILTNFLHFFGKKCSTLARKRIFSKLSFLPTLRGKVKSGRPKIDGPTTLIT